MFAGYKYCTVEDRKFILFIATAKTGLVAFRGYARLVRVRHLRQIVPLLLASVRRHLADRTPVRRQILKPTPKIFGVTITKCTLEQKLTFTTVTLPQLFPLCFLRPPFWIFWRVYTSSQTPAPVPRSPFLVLVTSNLAPRESSTTL